MHELHVCRMIISTNHLLFISIRLYDYNSLAFVLCQLSLTYICIYPSLEPENKAKRGENMIQKQYISILMNKKYRKEWERDKAETLSYFNEVWQYLLEDCLSCIVSLLYEWVLIVYFVSLLTFRTWIT